MSNDKLLHRIFVGVYTPTTDILPSESNYRFQDGQEYRFQNNGEYDFNE